MVEGDAKAQPKLGVVFEEGVAPGRPAPLRVCGPGRGGQVAAVDRGAAGGIGDHHPIPKQLAGELEVGGLTATGAGPRKFEQGLLELLLRDVMPIQLASIGVGKGEEKTPVAAALLPQRALGGHGEGLAPGIAGIPRRADLHTQAAAGAVLRCHLDREPLALPGRIVGGCRSKAFRGAQEQGGLHGLCTDHGVGAHHHALAALHAEIGLPDRDGLGDIALLPLAGAAGKAAVAGERTHRQLVAAALQLGQHQLPDCRWGPLPWAGDPKRLAGIRFHFGRFACAQFLGGRFGCSLLRRRDLPQPSDGGIDRRQVARHDGTSFFGVAVLDGGAHRRQGLGHRHHLGQGEEARLHHRVDAGPQAMGPRNRGGIHRKHPQPLGFDGPLDAPRQLRPALLQGPGAVQQQGAVGGGVLEQVELLEEIPVVACHELGLADQVSRADRLGAEAQVGHRDRSGFFGVVNEIALGLEPGGFADDFDAAFVGTDGAIGTQAIEDRPKGLGRFALGQLDVEATVHRQREVGDVVGDPHREVVPWWRGLEVVQDRFHHGWGELLGGQAIAAAHHLGLGAAPVLPDRGQHIEVEGFAGTARLLAAI